MVVEEEVSATGWETIGAIEITVGVTLVVPVLPDVVVVEDEVVEVEVLGAVVVDVNVRSYSAYQYDFFAGHDFYVYFFRVFPF